MLYIVHSVALLYYMIMFEEEWRILIIPNQNCVYTSVPVAVNTIKKNVRTKNIKLDCV